MNSVRLSIRISTRSPKPTPRRLSAPASAVTRRSSSRPGGGAAEEAQRRRIGLHQRVPGELVGPVLPAREVRLLGRRRLACPSVNGMSSGVAVLIFDQTLCCPGHTMASAARGQPRETDGGPVNAPARPPPRRAVRREQLSDEVAGHLRAAIMSGTLRPGTFIRLDETAAQLGSASHRCARRCARCAARAWCSWNRTAATSSSPLSRATSRTSSGCRPRSPRSWRAAAERITDDEIDELERLNDELAAMVETGRGRSHRRGGVRVPPRAQPARRAASSWPGSCYTWRATCRR